MFALITTLSTNLLRTYIIYRFMRLFFWTDIEEKKKGLEALIKKLYEPLYHYSGLNVILITSL